MIVLSWIAVNNDFDREGNIKTGESSGPTLGLFDKDCSYAGKVKALYLFYQKNSASGKQKEMCVKLKNEIEQREPETEVHPVAADYTDPTKHEDIREVIEKEVIKIRQKHSGETLYIHVSPGTPSMHSIWVLAASSGIIEQPVTLFQSHRSWKGIVREFSVDLESYYSAFKKSKSKISLSTSEPDWDPSKFKTNTMKDLFKTASGMAQLGVPVLIMGERGTGKTRLASWIRACSPFRNKKNDSDWPSIACGAYSGDTLKTQLLGYVKGAFTGADKDTPGLLKQANTDTLFLDEIGDISREMQRILIKAIEEKEFHPVGSQKKEGSDFRLITATNMSMRQFRETVDPDFFDRISYFILTMPPLREIKEEINWLFESALHNAIKRSGASMVISRKSIDFFAQNVRKLPLHGNFRDLYRLAYRIILGKSTDISDLNIWNDYLSQNSLLEEKQPENHEFWDYFAQKKPLQFYLENNFLDTKQVEDELRHYIGLEINRYKKNSKKDYKEISNLSQKTVNNYMNIKSS